MHRACPAWVRRVSHGLAVRCWGRAGTPEPPEPRPCDTERPNPPTPAHRSPDPARVCVPSPARCAPELQTQRQTGNLLGALLDESSAAAAAAAAGAAGAAPGWPG